MKSADPELESREIQLSCRLRSRAAKAFALSAPALNDLRAVRKTPKLGAPQPANRSKITAMGINLNYLRVALVTLAGIGILITIVGAAL